MIIDNNEINFAGLRQLPDRLLTEMYKDQKERERKRFEVIREYTNDCDIEKLQTILYKHPQNTYIFGEKRFKIEDIEAYIEYRTKEWIV